MLSPTRRPKAAPARREGLRVGTGALLAPDPASHPLLCPSAAREGDTLGHPCVPQCRLAGSPLLLPCPCGVRALTDDEDRHEGSTRHWDGGGQGRHPELSGRCRHPLLGPPGPARPCLLPLPGPTAGCGGAARGYHTVPWGSPTPPRGTLPAPPWWHLGAASQHLPGGTWWHLARTSLVALGGTLPAPPAGTLVGSQPRSL